MSDWQPIDDTIVDIPLTLEQSTKINIYDLPLIEGRIWKAQPRSDGNGYYAVTSSGVRMHRILMKPRGFEIVDHIDGDGLNNIRANLRVGTQSQNCVNRKITPGPYLRGARPKKGKWQAYIKYAGKQRSLGYYETEKMAHEAYLAEAVSMHGDWMPLPEPPALQPETE